MESINHSYGQKKVALDKICAVHYSNARGDGILVGYRWCHEVVEEVLCVYDRDEDDEEAVHRLYSLRVSNSEARMKLRGHGRRGADAESE